MKFLAIVLSWACLAFAADKNSAIEGVWRGQMDGVPALVMTISDEGGDLTGAILFYLIRRQPGQPPHSAPGIPEPLFNLKFDGKALDFRVSHRRSHGARTANDPPVSFRLKITGANEGLLVREGKESEAIRVSRDK
ncbi:MAG TPA: hypothetical protein VN442_00495 [Bryobacteraceae bacterium]|nr:hypothetical protein [Bryobacteraceae bacterium]